MSAGKKARVEVALRERAQTARQTLPELAALAEVIAAAELVVQTGRGARVERLRRALDALGRTAS